MKTSKTLPMKTAGTRHLIERTYRESGRYQWARETLVNAMEAGATRIDFGVEWQAVERKGVYRRVIADNGKGMTPTQLVEFFNVFGGGGKPIGGVHENFGVGSKTSLMPWNRHGMVVVSWVNGEASMIWVRRDRDSEEYGLRLFRAMDDSKGEETLEAVVEPFADPQSGCDWSKVKPDFIQDHGTVIILMGNDPKDNTVSGDPNHNEADLKGLAAYLNRRIWEIPDQVQVTVDEFRTSDKNQWPKSETEARGVGVSTRTNRRQIRGALHYIATPTENFIKGRLSDSGEMILKDKTKVRWFLWEGARPEVNSYAANQGFLAALYRNELYDSTNHLSTYRSFGITDQSVRQRVWLIMEPVPFDEKAKRGVYPRTDRNTLLLRGGPEAGAPLPMADWGAEFAENMPEPIREALRAAHQDVSKEAVDEKWRNWVSDRFGDRWRLPRLRQIPRGDMTVDPTQSGGEVVVRPRRPREERERDRENTPPNHLTTGTAGPTVVGVAPGAARAELTRLGVSIPTFRVAAPSELEPGMLAAWVPHDPTHPEGVVLLSSSHPVLQQQIAYWQSQYADHLAQDVEREVLEVYGQVAVCKIAHSEKLKGILPAKVVDDELRSERSLTMALLGLMAEEALISTRLGAKLGKRKPVEMPAAATAA